MILEIFSGGPAATNCVLLACENSLKGAIVDAPAGVGETVLKRANELGVSIEMLLLTHTHWDHIADLALLKKETQAPVYVHPLDAENVVNPGSDGLPLMFAIEGVEPDHFFDEGDELKLGDLSMKVIHTPGHSPGGICLYLPQEEALIAGDTLFQGSIGRLDLPGSEAEKMWTSLEKLAELPSATRVIPGHGDETTIGDERWLKDAKKYFGG